MICINARNYIHSDWTDGKTIIIIYFLSLMMTGWCIIHLRRSIVFFITEGCYLQTAMSTHTVYDNAQLCLLNSYFKKITNPNLAHQ